jgi:ABC-type multidrug transport system fused ATPase/permease subunit
VFASLWRHLSRRRQVQFILLLVLMLVSAFAEIVSLGAVLPFLGVLTAPDRVLSVPWVRSFASAMGIITGARLILPITIAFAVAALLAGAFRMGLLWASTRLAFASGADFSIEVYRRSLYQPYEVHVFRNSSEVISGITYKVGNVVEVLYQALLLLSAAVLIVAIGAALLLIDPLVALIATVGFGSTYALIASFFRGRLRRNSREIADGQTHVLKALQEGLGGIRDVLLDGTQPVYCEIYRRADMPLRRAQGNNLFVGASPRFAMEALGMVMIAALAYGMSRQAGGIGAAIPILGALALGAQRLLPVLQQAYTAWATIAGRYSSVADTIELLEQPLAAELLQEAPTPLMLQESVRFAAVRFRYAEGPWVLDGFDLTIRKGARVGIVGSTGSGKSTALDLLMGLLVPHEGEVLVDGESLRGSRIRAWQRAIAHVPQNIYLADATIAENIAFGVPPAQIDLDRVKQVARQAQIATLIEARPEGYNALVGERGVRLSGGQRQRIGIARALYKRASVLVFDEATSALDNTTEQSVMDAIEQLDRNLTILLIAHRLSTVKRCDCIVELTNGRVAAQGTYEQLLETSSTFRQMAQTVG